MQFIEDCDLTRQEQAKKIEIVIKRMYLNWIDLHKISATQDSKNVFLLNM